MHTFYTVFLKPNQWWANYKTLRLFWLEFFLLTNLVKIWTSQKQPKLLMKYFAQSKLYFLFLL